LRGSQAAGGAATPSPRVVALAEQAVAGREVAR
jgi:hypothetical protein